MRKQILKFIYKVVLFTIPVILFYFLILSFANGYTDPFYLRFTSAKQTSLILGTSRAAQGVNPEILNNVLGRSDVYNFAFTNAHSPYGSIYLNSIKRKLNINSNSGIFILTIDPWSISSKYINESRVEELRESNLCVSTTSFVNLKPNIPYLLKNYRKPLYTLINQKKSPVLLHKNGWLEVSVKIDSSLFSERILSKTNAYRTNQLPNYSFSEKRFSDFIDTIEYLKNYGNIYLVRLPVHPLMLNIDNELMPEFNKKINDLSKRFKLPYFDMTTLDESFTYIDGVHLYKESGKHVTKKIGKWILQHQLK